MPYLLLLVVTGTATYYSFYHLPLWLFFILLLVHGGLFAFMLNGFHELVHGTVFKSRWLNAALPGQPHAPPREHAAPAG